jgi:hypothetical protein
MIAQKAISAAYFGVLLAWPIRQTKLIMAELIMSGLSAS